LISESNDVVLSFPYKDCVLEGGQTKDDQKRDEIFYNITLARDEVDRLQYPKVLVNACRHSVKGIEKGVSFSNSDNLVIKGNNLLTISSLLKCYEGKIKCIYIDPPYNTGNDSFGYNDNFKRSTWLTFMLNRLTIAKRLIRKDGFIFIQINYKEMSYLRVLCDEIFGEDNYINTVTVQTATTASFRAINDCPVNVSEFILIYSVDKTAKNINPVYRPSDYSEDYGSCIENFYAPYDQWNIVSVDSMIYKQEGVSTWQEFREKYGKDWRRRRYGMKAAFCYKNRDRVVSLNTMQKPSREILNCIETSRNNRGRVFAVDFERDKPTYIYNGRTLAFYQKKFRAIDGVESPSEILTNIWEDISFLSLGNEGGVDLPNGKKPEKLIKRILELATNEGDIVLDFFAGTGTTGAVAHKMNRKYILCEQMDYIESKTIERLKGVINGDPGGISDIVGWRGGGSFIFCELAKLNIRLQDKVAMVKADYDLTALLERVISTGFISCKVNPSDITEAATDFESLSTENKKRFILELLDKNMLYVNLCDIEDKEYAISDADKAFTRSFYELEDN
jgi:adenine-specific DNA-methyltransferase